MTQSEQAPLSEREQFSYQTQCVENKVVIAFSQRTLHHRSEDVRAFYAQFPAPGVIGVEATGYARWFHHVVEETGHHLLVGDARRLGQFAERRQKNDQRDAYQT